MKILSKIAAFGLGALITVLVINTIWPKHNWLFSFDNGFMSTEYAYIPVEEPTVKKGGTIIHNVVSQAAEVVSLNKPKTIAIPLLPKDKNEAKNIIADIVAKETDGIVNSIIIDALIEQESNYNQFAKSNVGAKGLMQIMDSWVSKCGLQQVEELYDPYKNIRCGVAIFQDSLAMAQRNTKSKNFEDVLRNAFKYYNCSPKNALRNRNAKIYSQQVMAKIDHRLRRSLWAKPQAWKDRGNK